MKMSLETRLGERDISIIVWGRRNSVNVQKVMWAIGELEISYERYDVGGSFGTSGQYALINPQKTVPTIQDGELTLWESNACVRYLCKQYGDKFLWSEDPKLRALSDQWMDYQSNVFSSAFLSIFINKVKLPPQEQDPNQADVSASHCGVLMTTLDSHFADKRYITGEEMSMGDIPLGACMYRYFNMDIERPPLPNLKRWYEALCERPAYQKHVMIPFGSDFKTWQAQELSNAGIQ